MLEVGIHVERETVIADPSSDGDPYRADLFIADPYAREAGYSIAHYPEIGEAIDDGLLDISQEQVHILPVRAQVEYGVAYKLARPMICDVAAAIGVEYFHARLFQLIRLCEKAVFAAAGSQGDDRRVLEQQERVRYLAGKPTRDQIALEQETFLIID